MIAGVAGQMGGGKTLTISVVGSYFHNVMGVPLFANYDLKGATIIRTLADLQQVDNGVMCWQEMWLDMDSRQSGYSTNLSDWMNQTRKKSLLLLYDTQAMSQIDKRVRNGTQFLIWVQKKKDGTILLNFIDYQNGILGRRYRFNDPSMFYDIYDTMQVSYRLK